MRDERLKNVRGNIENGEEEAMIKAIKSIGRIEYKIFNPGGNKTALVNRCDYTNNQKRIINKMIMTKYPQVEQVGFLSDKIKHLEMAGGEFCINASRCAIYEYSKETQKQIEMTVSGTNKKIMGRILDDNKVEIKLEIGKNISDLIDIRNDLTYVKIEGIQIVIFDEEMSKKYIKKLRENKESTKNEIKEFMIRNIKTVEKAIGIMLLENVVDKVKVHPIVWVKDIDTVFYETACGSGSLGVALYNYYKNKEKIIELIQPSGYNIMIQLSAKGQYIEKAMISGIVEEL